MKKYYITKKRVNNFIETNIGKFESLESFRNELTKTIAELNDGTNPNQVRFYKRVKETLG